MGLGASCKSWPKRMCDSETNTGGGEVDTSTLYHNRFKRDIKQRLLYEEQDEESRGSDDDYCVADEAVMDGVPDSGSPKDAKRALYTLGLDGDTMKTIMDLELPNTDDQHHHNHNANGQEQQHNTAGSRYQNYPMPLASAEIATVAGNPGIHQISTVPSIPTVPTVPPIAPYHDITDHHHHDVASQSTASGSSFRTKSQEQIMMQYAAHHHPRQSTITSLHNDHHDASESDGIGMMHHRHHSPPQFSPFHFEPDDVADREPSPMAMVSSLFAASDRAPSPEPAVSALGIGTMGMNLDSNPVPSSTESDNEHFDHFDSDFLPLTVSMVPVALPMMPTMPEQGSRSVPASAGRARVQRSHSAKHLLKKSNLLRPKSTALWGDNDIDELHEEMSNQLQHLVTHSMSLDGSALGHASFAMMAVPGDDGSVPHSSGVGGRHNHSLSAGRIEELTAISVHGTGTETPKNLCSPQTADQWNDDDLDRQAEAIRMRLEQYRME